MTLEGHISGSSQGMFNPGGSAAEARLRSSLSRSDFATRASLRAGRDSLFRPALPGVGPNMRIVVQGLRAVSEHAAAVDAMIPGAIGIIHQQTGAMVVEQARKELRGEGSIRRAFLSGDTHDSVHSRLETTPDTVITSVGPTTFYSPLIEFGLARHFTYGPRPFMTISFSMVLPAHLQALRELAMVAAGKARGLSGKEHGPPTNSFIRRFRAWLYSAEKFAGDIIPGLTLPGLSGPREAAIGTARILGDIQAVMIRAVGARFVRRLEGKVTGRLIGIGSNTIFASRSVGARISGAERAYNRVAGKYMSKFIGQNKLFGGG